MTPVPAVLIGFGWVYYALHREDPSDRNEIVKRELAKSDPEAACKYLLSIKGQASGLTMREGAKRLPERLKKKVL